MMDKQGQFICGHKNEASVGLDCGHTGENSTRSAYGVSVFHNPDGGVRLEVIASRPIRYSTVHTADPVFDKSNPAVREAMGQMPALVVVDIQVHRLYGKRIQAYLDEYAGVLSYVLVSGAERSKTWSVVQRICEEAVRVQLPRHGVILAIGGGVTLDIAGFAASIFRRGINFIRVPTSLIGLVDVAVGIKQGINLLGNKGVLGAFYPATTNINDITFLATLPERHISCGMAEVIKMAVVRDPELFSTMENNVEALISGRFQNSVAAGEILIRAEQLMMEELQPNLFESRLRRLPDFGHTFSPMIEKASSWRVNHGEAVGIDMLISTGIAVLKGLCSVEVLNRLRRLLIAAKLPLTHEVCQPRILMAALNAVRAHRAGELNLVVPLEIGAADFVQDVSLEEIQVCLDLIVGGHSNAGCISGPGWDVSAMRSVA